mgnify:CR=1 FL=1
MDKIKLFDKYVNYRVTKGLEANLIDGLLWGLKLRGCSIRDNEIQELISITLRNQ